MTSPAAQEPLTSPAHGADAARLRPLPAETGLPSTAGMARHPAPVENAGIAAVFETWVERSPDALAAVEGEHALTYRELNERANRVAWFLRRRGVGRNEPVGICAHRSLELIVGQLGILKAGGAYVPLDATYPAARLRFMLEDCGARLVLTHGPARANLPAMNAEISCLHDDWPRIAAHPTENPPSVGSGDDLAYIIYTSGSSGRPKGCLIRQRGVVRLVREQDYITFGPDRRFLVAASPSFDAITFEIWAPLLTGGACVLFPDRRPDPQRLETVLRTQRVTSAFLTASLFHQLVDSHPQALAPLQELLVGGEVLSVPHLQRARIALPQVGLTNAYGPTECTTFACAHRITHLDPGAPSIPIGRPLNHTECHIVDSALRRVAPGEPGELLLGGAGLAQGYLNQPELTAEKFVRHPWSGNPAARLYRTGDRCRWLPDGTIEFLGRLDEQIKLRGFRIEPGEIERATLAVPGVTGAAVVAVGAAGGQRQLALFVATNAEPSRVIAAVRDALHARLPAPMTPAHIEAVPHLPWTASGKIDRQALTARFEAGQAKLPSPGTTADPGAEASLVQLWREKLGRAQLGPGSDFFQEGGDSLSALQIAARLQRDLQRPLPVGLLFECPTPRALAARLARPTGPSTLADTSPLPNRRAPVFVYVPGIHGLARIPKKLRQHLGETQRCFEGLQYPGAFGEEPLRWRVEEIATALVAQLEKRFPSDRLCLCGFSFGGVVAFEMARQFRARGRTIELVIIGNIAPAQLYVRRSFWEGMAARLLHVFEPPWSQAPARLGLLARKIRKRARRFLTQAPVPLSCMLASTTAYHNFQPQPYDGRVALLRCRPDFHDPLWRPVAAFDYGWTPLVRGPFSIHPVPCRHMDLFQGAGHAVIRELLARV